MALDQLSTAVSNSADFPIRDTFLGDYPFEHHLHSHFGRLNERDKSKLKLFCTDEAETELYFIELQGQSPGEYRRNRGESDKKSKLVIGAWRSRCVESLTELESHLGVTSLNHQPQKDPKCRFLSVLTCRSLH